jgi:hypothetical protein
MMADPGLDPEQLLRQAREGRAQALGAAERKGIRSTSNKVETTIKFVNRSKQTIKVYWLDYEGKRQLKETVKDGDSYESKRTYLTHPWLTTDKDENAWDIYFPDARPRTVEILGPVNIAAQAAN